MDQVIRSAKQLGSLIHNARTKRNLSQQALADLVGTGQKTISRIENGHDGTKLETLFSVMSALDLDMQFISRRKGWTDIGDIF